MAYSKTTWVAGGAPGISAANLNKLETQYDEVKTELVKSSGSDIAVHGATLTTATITLAKLANIATARILGRTTAGSGVIEELTATAVRGMLNVADGAAALGETSATAYRGDRGKTAYDHSQTVHAVRHVTANEQTGPGYTLVLSDDSKLVDMNRSTAQALTVPPYSSVQFPTGTQILIRQKGAGQVTITAGSGVTLQSADSALKTRVQNSVAGLLKIDTDTWVVFGDLVA